MMPIPTVGRSVVWLENIGTPENPGELRRLAGTNNQSGNVVIVRGFQHAEDGGGGSFSWTDDTTTPDDRGTVIEPGATPRAGCWKRLFDGPLSVKWFGATGVETDPDQHVAIQAAVDALATSPCHGTLAIPCGRYLLGDTIRLSGEMGIILQGAGSDKAWLMWGGAPDGTMLLMANCQRCTVKDLGFEAGNPNNRFQTHAGCAIESRSVAQPVKGVPVPTGNRFENVEIRGYDPGARGFDRGIRLTADPGHDQNNDQFHFDHCRIQFCTEAGFSIEHGQSRVHYFFNCVAGYCGYGISTGKPELAAQPQDFVGGAFKWYGGAFGGNRTDVLLGPPNESIVISGAISEGSERFIEMQGSAASNFPVTIDGVYFSSDQMPLAGTDAAGRPFATAMRFFHAGPITVRGCQVGTQQSVKDGKPTRVKIRYEPAQPWAGYAALVSVGNCFATDEIQGAPFDPYDLPNPIGSLISLGNNLRVLPHLAAPTPNAANPGVLPNRIEPPT